ncbi:sigma-70 RNA polymerase sigma factor region 4 domain-containing protein [Companilactobacillus hulinensis]|uniref:sigma-70 family RNA polymerase sigma factor n=1 Tax=Companilactobacillus hulinensis TaxID=2486007 RepID=UPI000F7B05C4|nr:sigma-70 family RNA polymerase sigma factor [Companilactobacillus hulinensis]
MATLEEGFNKAIVNKRLIHGVLKRVNIYQTRFDYDDYFQEAVIIFAHSFVDFMNEYNDETGFDVHIYQKLKWRMTDLLRQDLRFSEIHSFDEFDFSIIEQEANNQLECLDLQGLSEIESLIFQEHFINNNSLSILARRYECSTRNLRYHRNRLLAKLRLNITV